MPHLNKTKMSISNMPKIEPYWFISKIVAIVSFFFHLFLVGCSSIGPDKIHADRYNYGKAISDSSKSQLLENLVRLRYADTPVFIDVGQVVSGYSLQRQVNASATGVVGAVITAISGSASVNYNDNPTVTYSPVVGEQFAQLFISNIPPGSILSAMQSGFSAEGIIRLAVQSINGVKNQRVQGALTASIIKKADPDFFSLIDYFSAVQEAGDFGVRANEKGKIHMILRNTPSYGGTASYKNNNSGSAIAGLKRILHLDQSVNEFNVVFGSIPRNKREIAIDTRSMYEVLRELSLGIDVPETHIFEQRVALISGNDLDSSTKSRDDLIRVKSSEERPTNAYVSINYNDYWFWIDDTDRRSKLLFSSVLLLFTFVQPASKAVAPVITIPTTR